MNNTLENAIETYGELHQLIVAMEECSELNQAISKICRRWRGEEVLIKDMDMNKCLDNLSEEMADVYICFQQLLIMFENQDDVQMYIDQKIARLGRRLEEEKGIEPLRFR